MKYNKLIGNIFVVDTELDQAKISATIIVTIITLILLFIYENEPIKINGLINSLIYPFVATVILLVGRKYELIKKFFSTYFTKSSLKISNGKIIMYLAILLIFLFQATYINIVVVALFIISGFMRIIIQNTKALFFADISEFMDFIKIYGYIRASFFALAILWLLKKIMILISYTFVLNSVFFWTTLLFIIFLFEVQFISNLYPYCEKHKDIENTILIIREIAKNKHIKINKISSCIGVPNNFVNKQLLELVDAKYIVKRKKKSAELEEYYKKIYTDGL